jgi:hypothetical protein
MHKVMKTILYFVATVLCHFGLSAQNIEFKTNPIGFAFGATNVSLEKPLPNMSNVTLNASAWHYSATLKDWMDIERNFGASVGIRRYLTSEVDNGLYLGMASRYMDRDVNQYYWDPATNETITYEVPSSYGSLGFTLGYKLMFEKRITIDFFGGAGRILLQESGGVFDAPAEWIGGFNFGYRF